MHPGGEGDDFCLLQASSTSCGASVGSHKATLNSRIKMVPAIYWLLVPLMFVLRCMHQVVRHCLSSVRLLFVGDNWTWKGVLRNGRRLLRVALRDLRDYFCHRLLWRSDEEVRVDPAVWYRRFRPGWRLLNKFRTRQWPDHAPTF